MIAGLPAHIVHRPTNNVETQWELKLIMDHQFYPLYTTHVHIYTISSV